MNDNHPKLLIVDSAGSHLNPDLINDLRTKRVVVPVVPKGCTMYVQVLDVSVFAVFKNHYDDVVEEFIDKSGSRCKIKPGLPNPNFRNQGFSKKNQEFIRSFFSRNQEENQESFF